jgi:PAS domain S-box-containing protein
VVFTSPVSASAGVAVLHRRNTRIVESVLSATLRVLYDGEVAKPSSLFEPPLQFEPSSPFEQYEQMAELLDVAPGVMFCVKDSASRYVVVNHAFAERTGKADRRAVIGAMASDLFPPELATRYEAQDEEVLRSGKALRNEVELITDRLGNAGWFITNKRPILSPDGLIVGVLVVSIDLRTAQQDRAGIDQLAAVTSLASEHLGRNVEVSELALAAGLSAAQLERRMRKVFGMSPRQYLLRVRVDEAARRLTSTTEPLAEVAHHCGWYDQSAFTRQFTRAAGYTPGDYRARHRR